MKKPVSFGSAFIALVVLATLVVFPVSGMVYPPPTAFSSSENGTVPGTAGVTATMAAKQFVGARISSGSPDLGEPVTINGLVTGSVLPADIQIWVFAGNYVNVSKVPVNSDGTVFRTYTTTGLPLATYYVYVQSPGANGIYNIDLEDTGIFSGKVVNTQTNTCLLYTSDAADE